MDSDEEQPVINSPSRSQLSATDAPSGVPPTLPPQEPGTPYSQRSAVAGTPSQRSSVPLFSQTRSPFSARSSVGATPGAERTSGWGTPMAGTPFSQRSTSSRAPVPRSDLGRLAQHSILAAGKVGNSSQASSSTPARGAFPPQSPTGSLGGGSSSKGGGGPMSPASGAGKHSSGRFDASSPGAAGLSPKSNGTGGSPGGSLRSSRTGGGGGGDEEGSQAGGGPAAGGNAEEAVIWGTNVNVTDAMERFRDFVLEFGKTNEATVAAQDAHSDIASEIDHPEESLGLYARALIGIRTTGMLNLAINCQHMGSHPTTRKLYHQLVQYPQEIVPIMDLVVHQLYLELSPDGGAQAEADLGGQRIQARPYNLQDVHKLRELDPSNIDQLVAVTGMVTRVSPMIPDLKQGFFQCYTCRATAEVMIDRGRIDEPTSCPNCKNKFCMEMVHNRSLFSDKQMVRLQETPDDIPEGETPQAVTLFGFQDLVDSVRPGDRVEVTGIFRAIPKRVNPKMRSLRSVYKTHLDVIHYRLVSREGADNNDSSSDGNGRPKKKGAADGEDDSELGLDDDDEDNGADNGADGRYKPDPKAYELFSAARLKAMSALAKDPSVYSRLTAALAPGIWELDDVKKGVLCQLFGGAQGAYDTMGDDPSANPGGPRATRGKDGDGGGRDGSTGHKARGEINVLLCGDPGTSKSQLLTYVRKIAPRGVYTSGKGSSAVGLTASVVRDAETRDLVLESGALVLSDLGICCIDEFDKMSDTTRAILHEAMEQQTISIAKAGIICTLNARTSILASANPVESRYNPRKSVVENIQLPPTLLSRFDLIYLILDKPSSESDRRLAKHLVSLYYETPKLPPSGGLDHGLMRDYIAYARRFVHPVISDDAERELIEGYLEMRRLGGNAKTITATPRQLESLIRLSEALARMKWAPVVERSDVVEAIRLMKVATQTAATDPRTGTIDMDMITTGHSALDRGQLAALKGELMALFQDPKALAGQRLNLVDLRKKLEDANGAQVSLDELRQAVQQLAEEGQCSFVERTGTVVCRGSSGGGQGMGGGDGGKRRRSSQGAGRIDSP